MDKVDRLQVGRTAYQLRIDHGPDAYLYAARLAREADADGKPEEAAFWRAVYAALRPRSVVPPTKEEIAKMSTKELYDLFGTRYPNVAWKVDCIMNTGLGVVPDRWMWIGVCA